ncbi:MAG: FAD-dependent thymidylate synthase [Chitinispirillales bacterium]|jgi:thymidylate synthase ThyX|nr:FAD-dependent thymidylate synthase [Chitinispirillales bacterium]
MKVTLIPTTAPLAAKDLTAVTPELLASVLAKYSRSNLGIDKILQNVDKENPDASVEKIFKFIDYGHASIGGLTGGIAVTIDGCSMFLAYKIFEIAQLADGQESSTRYIKMSPESLISPDEAGIPQEIADEWRNVFCKAFDIYNKEYAELDEIAEKFPEKLRISPDEPEKVRKRILKNYALDRCRSFIPFATKTCAAYVMTARVWCQTLRELESLPLFEAKTAAKQIREELKKIVPNLIKHSFADEASIYHAESLVNYSSKSIFENGVEIKNVPDKVFVKMFDEPCDFIPEINDISQAFSNKTNRYSVVGSGVKRQFVKFAFNNISIAELRDLNRHRSGNKFTALSPVGFYLPPELSEKNYKKFFTEYASLLKKLAKHNLQYYGYLLGTQVAFEHSTHLDKVIYEIELRTGKGAHFRYAQHLETVAKKLIEISPHLKNHIQIGTAEPE